MAQQAHSFSFRCPDKDSEAKNSSGIQGIAGIITALCLSLIGFAGAPVGRLDNPAPEKGKQLKSDFSATTDALPAIISNLQGRGFELVTISTLLDHAVANEKSANAIRP